MTDLPAENSSVFFSRIFRYLYCVFLAHIYVILSAIKSQPIVIRVTYNGAI